MKKIFIGFIVLLFLAQACASSAPTLEPHPTALPVATESPASATEVPVDDTASRLKRLGGYPCPESDFTCVKVSVPFDHFDPNDSRTFDVVFAVLPATGQRKGMFVTSVGGPGGSGLLSADNYTSYFDPSIPENFDIVFFDQRGINESNGLYCAQAAVDFYLAGSDAATSEGEQRLLDVSQTFVNDCITEIGDASLLPYLDTTQAVEDLEDFRVLMEDEKFWLYGESYGTQFAQTYAAAHAGHVAGLVLDGVVDLTLTDIEFLKGQAAAFNEVLLATLEGCNADEACTADMGRDAVSIYDELAAQLKQAPISFKFTRSTGEVDLREFTFSDLESTSGFLYSETARMIFLRALAAYSRDNTIIPLARVAYNALYLNPDTFEVFIDLSYSDAIYYGVTCRDYAEPGNTPQEQAANFIKEGDEIDTSLPRLASVFYGDLPCAYWPYPQDDSRPAPFAEPFRGEGFPTLVLNATTDPATPYSGAQSVYSNLTDGYLVTEVGGPHVIFGWGLECVDSLVTDFLVQDKMPAQRETLCEGIVADEFVPLAPANAADYADLLEAFTAVDNEINYLPEYYYMNSTTARAIACPYGGIFAFDSGDTGDLYTFTNCAFSNGFAMTGSGAYNTEDGSFILEVDVTGLRDGSLTYTRDNEGSLHLSGTYGGGTVDLSE